MSTTIKLSQVLATLEKRASIDGSEHIILSVGAENKYAKPDDLRTYVLANVQKKLDKIGADDMHVRCLGTGASYDDITALVKAIDLSSLDNQGLWYVSMRGVIVLLSVEIKYIGDTSTAACAMVTLYGGVSVNERNSLSQDLALHVLTIAYDSNGWGEWKEYYNSADMAKAQTDITALQTRATAAEKNISAAQSSITDLQGKAATLETKAATAETDIAALQTRTAAIDSRTQGVSATDMPTRYLGTVQTYDAGAALLKALNLSDLNNQGYWYFSMNGVRILCQLEIKDIGSRAVATIYGGVRAAADGSLTQDGAFHILTTYYQDGAWAGWAEYFDATKITALETRATSLETRAAAVEAKATGIQTNAESIEALQEKAHTAEEFQRRLKPTGLEVFCIKRITVSNTQPVYINAVLTPTDALQNIIYISDNRACFVTADGRIRVLSEGVSTIQVIPTCNTALAKTISIEVGKPFARLNTLQSLRLSSDKAFRLT